MVRWGDDGEYLPHMTAPGLPSFPLVTLMMPLCFSPKKPGGKGKRLPEVYCIVSRLGCFSLFSKVRTCPGRERVGEQDWPQRDPGNSTPSPATFSPILTIFLTVSSFSAHSSSGFSHWFKK